jgi:hypothetical protein
MSAGFGWSLSDVLLLAQYAGRIHQALKDEGGSASEYQQATKTLLSLQCTLEQIQHGLENEDPSFHKAIQGQLEGPTNTIAGFNAKLRDKYGDRLGVSTSPSRSHGTWQKARWAFSAVEEVRQFWMGLSKQLEIVKLLIISETKSDLTVMNSRLKTNQQTSEAIQEQLRIVQAETQQSQASSQAVIRIAENASNQSDAAVASMRELHALFLELKHQHGTSQLTNQYAQIQNRIEEIKEALKDQATRPEGSCNGRGSMLLQSRNGITRTLLGVLDIIGERVETRFANQSIHV